ncbi:MAG: flagellar filament capping protein FliD [Burkholderiales bacterium]|nr:flagellar filament capping protein FliD [Burkholderiales bacterium]
MLAGSAVSARPTDARTEHDSPELQVSARISPTGRMQNTIAQLADTVRRLNQADTWRAATAHSSDPDRLDASALQAKADQVVNVQVDQIATAQSAISAQFSPLGTTIGLGTLNIEVGQWSSSFSSFTPNPNWPKARVSTGPGDTTLEHLRDRINGAGLGVNANVISDPTGTYLILRAANTGSDNGFRVTVDPAPGSSQEQIQSLQKLEFNPPSSTSGMTLAVPAQDAVVQANGKTTTSSSNFIEDLVPGVDATAKQASAMPIQVQVRQDSSQAKALIEDFVHTFNDLNHQLNTASGLDPIVAQAGQAVQSGVTSITHSGYGGSLEKLGVTQQQNGQLKLDYAALEQGLTQAVKEPPGGIRQLARIFGTDSPSEPTSPPAIRTAALSASTSPLFRQAVVDQYTHNMYVEDVN